MDLRLVWSIMSIPSIVLYYVLGLAFCAFFLLLKWNDLRYRRKGVPPGTMGWPIFGETSGFLKQGPDFMKAKKARYGSIFKTHVLGSPTIICMDPDVNKYILLNESKGLVAGYPESMRTILGDKNIAAVHGALHKHIRGSLVSLVGPAAIRDHLLPKTDQFMRSFLHNWAGQTIDIQEKTKQMAFFVSMKQIVEDVPSSFHEEFKAIFDNIVLGTISLPIKIPGTNYYRGLQTREKVIRILKEILAKRRASSATYDDMLDKLVRHEDVKYKLNDEELIDQIITVLNSGYETVSTTTMMAIKYLHDHPKVLQQLRVIFETSRLATIVNGVLRKAITDVELNGVMIPKGWRVYVYTREINYDPFLYPEPFTFNPSRWLEKGLESHNHQMLFGAGIRMCPGKELGIIKISVFLHYFLTKFRWEEMEGNKIVKFPRVEAPNGLNIRVAEY
ncbi:cytochrome P450 85A-like [Senna tora]|uniref:Cytochrome P450 85A-like n=1 Tax=Senna tora TaxID=362788 RepID=A0A834STS2_9FABA|nr:cytochrome P450 85A-like [Senna tora]